jgi:hypothetical protein
MTRDELDGFVNNRPFQRFVLVTQGGLRVEIPHPEFIALPPGEASYIIVFQRIRVRSLAPLIINLDAIDHLDLEPAK